MAQFIAGETINVAIENEKLTLKIEDASKSDTISARVEEGQSEKYKVGQIYEFDRELLAKSSS